MRHYSIRQAVIIEVKWPPAFFVGGGRVVCAGRESTLDTYKGKTVS